MKILTNLLMIVLIAVAIFVLIYLPWPALLALVVLLVVWMALTRSGRQAWSVTKVGIATIPQRLGSSLVIVIGIAGVVGVLVAVLAMAEGFRQTLQQTGDTNTAIVLRGGATAELSSGVGRDEVTLIQQLPGILKDAQGKAIASPELVVVANIPKKGTATDANVEIRRRRRAGVCAPAQREDRQRQDVLAGPARAHRRQGRAGAVQWPRARLGDQPRQPAMADHRRLRIRRRARFGIVGRRRNRIGDLSAAGLSIGHGAPDLSRRTRSA